MDVFISRPTSLEEPFEVAYSEFNVLLLSHSLRPRRLGASDYPRKAPLREVINVMKCCRGAIVLGYPQVSMRHEVRHCGRPTNDWGHVFPTPWNQIEGALAYREGFPVLVVAQHNVTGGVFDYGVTGEMVIHMDLAKPDWCRSPVFQQPFGDWLREVGLTPESAS